MTKSIKTQFATKVIFLAFLIILSVFLSVKAQDAGLYFYDVITEPLTQEQHDISNKFQDYGDQPLIGLDFYVNSKGEYSLVYILDDSIMDISIILKDTVVTEDVFSKGRGYSFLLNEDFIVSFIHTLTGTTVFTYIREKNRRYMIVNGTVRGAINKRGRLVKNKLPEDHFKQVFVDLTTH